MIVRRINMIVERNNFEFSFPSYKCFFGVYYLLCWLITLVVFCFCTEIDIIPWIVTFIASLSVGVEVSTRLLFDATRHSLIQLCLRNERIFGISRLNQIGYNNACVIQG